MRSPATFPFDCENGVIFILWDSISGGFEKIQKRPTRVVLHKNIEKVNNLTIEEFRNSGFQFRK